MTVSPSADSPIASSSVQVDFYIIHKHAPQAVERFICRLIEKAYQQHYLVFIQANSAEQAKHLDQLLWVVNPDSFIPHALLLTGDVETTCLNGQGDSMAFPVLISYGNQPQTPRSLLVNLTATVPVYFDQFQRIAEVVTPDEPARVAGRQRFRFYREQKFTLSAHDISL
ncbi:DNA polymerase III, chi subunit [Beggiatoa alba B18LD]|uniref:DNA polymerase III, chi subunit n=1 Tax=Beggiatoa alba B18LD TaxID=395493 RepID=I3CIV7_9GAMM|nr:DNA polymerase III subunit chi [Beggiatoa alba]EIJ43550.1 DNA polymerase III, chi subunit [Beggiatoa alba B18LD]